MVVSKLFTPQKGFSSLNKQLVALAILPCLIWHAFHWPSFVYKDKQTGKEKYHYNSTYYNCTYYLPFYYLWPVQNLTGIWYNLSPMVTVQVSSWNKSRKFTILGLVGLEMTVNTHLTSHGYLMLFQESREQWTRSGLNLRRAGLFLYSNSDPP